MFNTGFACTAVAYPGAGQQIYPWVSWLYRVLQSGRFFWLSACFRSGSELWAGRMRLWG